MQKEAHVSIHDELVGFNIVLGTASSLAVYGETKGGGDCRGVQVTWTAKMRGTHILFTCDGRGTEGTEGADGTHGMEGVMRRLGNSRI